MMYGYKKIMPVGLKTGEGLLFNLLATVTNEGPAVPLGQVRLPVTTKVSESGPATISVMLYTFGFPGKLSR
jgi:hypothetical protein